MLVYVKKHSFEFFHYLFFKHKIKKWNSWWMYSYRFLCSSALPYFSLLFSKFPKLILTLTPLVSPEVAVNFPLIFLWYRWQILKNKSWFNSNSMISIIYTSSSVIHKNLCGVGWVKLGADSAIWVSQRKMQNVHDIFRQEV